ncbi:foldase protein PrsA [Salinibacillus kushneri]|uniref:Foldase protein PrsA n=1 Tax=Salinibacillus kushneri TaxID=237682 RepID=A0A1I0AY22_9BACI|nr:peptidylprolyl isomerase [Salinibacillus kushneri]SES98705.1 foldase protein PrsA [Salinibacillus kushneri]
MKKLAIGSILAIFVLALAACSQDNGEVVVETEAGNITKDEFYEELKSTAGENVLNNMVVTQVLEDKYDAPKEEIDSQIKEYKDQMGDQFEMFLQQNNFKDEKAFREQLKFNMLYEQALTDGIEISDEAIQKRYNRMQYEVEVSHILVNEKKKAQEMIDQLAEGADFAKLAKENSQDPGSASEGGSLGFIKITDNYVAPFKDAAFNLEPGELSEPVQSSNGWHVIKVTDKRDVEKELEPLEDMKEEIRRTLAMEQVQGDQQKAQEKVQKLIDDANIDVKIDEYKDMFKNNSSTGNNENSGNSGDSGSNENNGNNE